MNRFRSTLLKGQVKRGMMMLLDKLNSLELIRFLVLLLSALRFNSTPALIELVILMPSLFRLRFCMERFPDNPNKLPALATVALLELLLAE